MDPFQLWSDRESNQSCTKTSTQADMNQSPHRNVTILIYMVIIVMPETRVVIGYFCTHHRDIL